MGLMFFAGVTGNVAWGQEVTIAKGEPGKEMDEEMVRTGWFLGQRGEHDCWLTRTKDGPKSFVRRDDWQVVEVDRNLRVQGRLELPMSRKCEVVTARQLGSRADVILVDSSDAKRLTVVKVQVDLDSMMLQGHRLDTLANYALESGNKSYVWGERSENDEYIGVLVVVQKPRSHQYMAEAMMYDDEMEQVWRREYAVGTTSSIGVSNEGEMVTLGYEGAEGGVRFTINVLGHRTGDTYGLTMACDRIKAMQIVDIRDRKVQCVGLFSPSDSHPKEKLVGGTVSMVFDMDSASMTGFVVRPFQNEDVNILLNKKTKKIQREQEVPMVTPLAVVRMPYGVVMAVGHRHVMRYKNANGTIETSYFAQGIHLVATDRDGNVKWTRNIRRNDMQKDTDEKLYVALFAMGDEVCLMKSESRKYPASYDIAKEAKEFEMGDKSNLVLYRVSEEGEVSKTILEQKTKHSLVSAAKKGDREAVALTLDGSKSRRMEMGVSEQ